MPNTQLLENTFFHCTLFKNSTFSLYTFTKSWTILTLRKVVGNGNTTSFWRDHWTTLCPLCSCIHGPLNFNGENLIVRDARINDDWNWDLISLVFPPYIKSILQATRINSLEPIKDTLAWTFCNDGNFSIKSAYLLAKGINPMQQPLFPAKLI